MDVPKGLGAETHQRRRLWALKTKVLRFWNGPYIHKFVYAYACMLHADAYVPRNPNFDNFDYPTSNGHNSLNLSENLAKFMFKLKLRMSNFQ